MPDTFKDFTEEMGEEPVWSRHTDEDMDDYDMFVAYWLGQTGRRSLQKAVHMYDSKIIASGGRPTGNRMAHMSSLSRFWFWRERGAAYQKQQDDLEIDEALKDAKWLREERKRIVTKWSEKILLLIAAVDPKTPNSVRATAPAINAFIAQLRKEEEVLLPTVESNRDLERKVTVIRTEDKDKKKHAASTRNTKTGNG